MSNEQIYLYRRKGRSDYATCDRASYVELSQHKLFETMVCYASPEPEEGDHEGRQLEWERAENKRLRDELDIAKDHFVCSEQVKSAAYRRIDELVEVLAIARGSIKEICHERNVPLPNSTLRRIDAAIPASAESANKESAQ